MSSRQDKWYGMNWIRQEKRLAIYIRDNFVCQHCGVDLKALVGRNSDLRVELDHIVPVSHGGGNEATNLVTSCNICNLERSDTILMAYHSPAKAQAIVYQAQQPINVVLAKQALEQRKAARKGGKQV